jgi:hypothetical protein
VRRVTKIRVLGETWRVPRGFGREYARVARDDLALVRSRKPGEVISTVIDLLALVGYEATPEQVAGWDLRRRVEAVVHAGNEMLRASDNPLPRHPRPRWLPRDPWKGPPNDAGGIFSGRRGTPIPVEGRP